ncbi:MAG: hypothetical protein O3A21_05235 [Proteobacteria bacterium]|nr:hypothetical protein [Pseudomonadota bacterium]
MRDLLTDPIEVTAEEETAFDDGDGPTTGLPDDGDEPTTAWPQERASAVPMTTAAFEAELQELIDGHGKVLAGKMQFIDISSAKEKYPEQWEDVVGSLHALAAAVISMHLAREDIYTRLQEAHVIIFADLAQAEAKERCVRISNEISELLAEEGVDPSIVAAKTVVGEVDGQAALEALDIDASSKPLGNAKSTKPRSKWR